MRLRLPRWLRRPPAPQGRHLRGTVPVTVPGAASALVAAASEPLLVPVQPPVQQAAPLPDVPPDAAAAAVADPAPSGQVLDTDGDGAPTVSLGFADGEVHALPPDDPRLTSFQDAAAAVLGRSDA